MLSSLNKIRDKFRYGLATHFCLYQLSRVGISIIPYIIYREDSECSTEQPSSKLSVEIVTSENHERLSSFFASEGQISSGDWRRRLQEGQLGLVMYSDGEPVGCTWASLIRYSIYGKGAELEPTQAYLRHTYTAKRFRGRGMAPLIRQAMYRELLSRGRSRFLSVSDFLNTPARKFKKHLGAKPQELRLSLRILKRMHADIHLRDYDISIEPEPATARQ